MKKCLFFAMAVCFAFASWGISFAAQDINIGKLPEKQKMAMAKAKKGSPSLGELKNALDAVKGLVRSDSRKSSRELSSDPRDLQPITGTSWAFGYTMEGYAYIDSIVFDTEIKTFSEGDVGLACWDQYGAEGLVQYDSETGFLAMFISPLLTYSYIFLIQGEEASGQYFSWLSISEPIEDADFYPMAGIISYSKGVCPPCEPECPQEEIDQAVTEACKTESCCQSQVDAAVAQAITDYEVDCQCSETAVANAIEACKADDECCVPTTCDGCQPEIEAAVAEAVANCPDSEACQEKVTEEVEKCVENCPDSEPCQEKVDEERKKWDANDDNLIGLEEAVQALKAATGITIPSDDTEVKPE